MDAAIREHLPRVMREGRLTAFGFTPEGANLPTAIIAVRVATAQVYSLDRERMLVNPPSQSSLPALHIETLGVDLRWARQGQGEALVNHVTRWAYAVRPSLALRLITVDSVNEPGALQFYGERLVFEHSDAPATDGLVHFWQDLELGS